MSATTTRRQMLSSSDRTDRTAYKKTRLERPSLSQFAEILHFRAPGSGQAVSKQSARPRRPRDPRRSRAVQSPSCFDGYERGRARQISAREGARDTRSLSPFARMCIFSLPRGVRYTPLLRPRAPNGLKDISSRRGRRHTVMNE